jgi:hypothetical protein
MGYIAGTNESSPPLRRSPLLLGCTEFMWDLIRTLTSCFGALHHFGSLTLWSLSCALRRLG